MVDVSHGDSCPARPTSPENLPRSNLNPNLQAQELLGAQRLHWGSEQHMGALLLVLLQPLHATWGPSLPKSPSLLCACLLTLQPPPMYSA